MKLIKNQTLRNEKENPLLYCTNLSLERQRSRMKNKITFIIICLCLFPQIKGQQYDPLYTQYMFNSLAINPAYAGTSGSLNAMIMSRQQWVGLPDAPNTQTFSIHSPVASRYIGAGLSFIYDRMGPIQNINLSMDYSFKFKIAETVHTSLGLKGAISSFQSDLTKFQGEVGNDDAYYEHIDRKLLPNFGFGIYCYGNKFYVGASVPRLLENVYSDDGSVSSITKKENRLYMAMAGVVIGINPFLKLKPSFILRLSNSVPISSDLNLNALINDMLWVGGMYRYKEGYGAIVQVQITNQLRFGYAFEMTTNQMRAQQYGTHEIMLSYDFIVRKENIQNPRYF